MGSGRLVVAVVAAMTLGGFTVEDAKQRLAGEWQVLGTGPRSLSISNGSGEAVYIKGAARYAGKAEISDPVGRSVLLSVGEVRLRLHLDEHGRTMQLIDEADGLPWLMQRVQ